MGAAKGLLGAFGCFGCSAAEGMKHSWAGGSHAAKGKKLRAIGMCELHLFDRKRAG